MERIRSRRSSSSHLVVHELSLCQAIADTAIAYAGDHPILGVYVQIGYLRQVVPDTLRFSWDIVAEGGALKGCELHIDHVPAIVECNSCGATTKLEQPVRVCASCHSRDTLLRSGDEFSVVSIDVLE